MLDDAGNKYYVPRTLPEHFSELFPELVEPALMRLNTRD